MAIPKKESKETDAAYSERLVAFIEELKDTHSTALAKLVADHGDEITKKDAEIGQLTAALEAKETEIATIKGSIGDKDAEIEKLKAELAAKDEAVAAKIKELKAAPAVKTVEGTFEHEGVTYAFKDGYVNTRIPAHLGPYTVKVDDQDVKFEPKGIIPSELALQVPNLMEYLIEIGYGGLRILEQ